ncbi:MAG TPA: uridine kinase [Mesotoga sp.]|jgi:uridine kinase|nr:uridine kinase [Mesotoga sp.]MDI9375440.1 uridine kinase [Thermotogota bacterium]NLX33217.1 uridine kinase [Thermotogaceae bacterium]MDD4040020.1 uridine kinase [Mesotoga sp.]MDD5743159.1 uridine kinase [Mesotoga sp.]
MVLVSIIGGSGAGKTSVTNVIYNHFNDRAAVLSMDDYYKNLEPGTDPREFNFDSPKAFDFELFESHLRTIKENGTVKVPVYSMVTYRREDGIWRTFEPRPLVLVEGLLVMFRKEMRELFDFSIYIDAPADERLIRRIERDTRERGRSLESIITQYRKFVSPSFESFIEPQKYFCDIVLPDGAANTTGLNVIINAIENMLKK